MITFDPTRPIYLQIVAEIKKRAVRDEYQAGSKLPSVRDMSSQMGVNPNTMARAFKELEAEGFIEARRGLGSFIAESENLITQERESLAVSALKRFLDEIRQLRPDENLLNRLRERQEEDWT